MFGEIIIATMFLLNYGYVESDPNPLTIIGGNTTSNRTYRFLVSVNFRHNDCGGCIISSTFVITAAHCVHAARLDPVLSRTILVRVGSSDPVPGPASLVSYASELFEHPHYNHETKVNDISLLKLQETLEFGDNIRAIRLPRVAVMEFKLDTIIKAIGFGESIIGDDVVYTNILKEANLEIKADATCRDKYGIILNSQICAANENITFCNRDEGSPVLFEGQLIGIVSLTAATAQQRGYTVLVRVPHYLEFIKQRIRPPRP